MAGRLGAARCGSEGGERGGAAVVQVSGVDRKGQGDGGGGGRGEKVEKMGERIWLATPTSARDVGRQTDVRRSDILTSRVTTNSTAGTQIVSCRPVGRPG